MAGGSLTPPLVVVGDPDWSNYRVSVDVLLEKQGMSILSAVGSAIAIFPALRKLSFAGYKQRNWSFSGNIAGHDTQLESGTTSFGWTLAQPLTQIRIRYYSGVYRFDVDCNRERWHIWFGQIGLLVSKWQNAEFDNSRSSAPLILDG